MNMLKQDLTGMRIRVSKEHIVNSCKGNPSKCAIAEALLSVFPIADYMVTITDEVAILIYRETAYQVRCYLSEAIQCWIRNFDEGEDVEAFTMIINRESFGYELQIAELTQREKELQGCIGELIELSNHMHLVNEGYAFRTNKFDDIMNRYQELYADTIYKFGTGDFDETSNTDADKE